MPAIERVLAIGRMDFYLLCHKIVIFHSLSRVEAQVRTGGVATIVYMVLGRT